MNADVLVCEGSSGLKPAGIVTTSGGDIYVAAIEMVASIDFYKSTNIGATWSLVDSAPLADIFPTGSYIGEAHIAIDGADIIHVVAGMGGDQGNCRDHAYCAFDTSTDTFGLWETINEVTYPFDAEAPCSISIDSNNKPHIIFTYQYSTQSGNHILAYTNRVSGSWSAREDIDPTPNYAQYQRIECIVRDIDNIEVLVQVYQPSVSYYVKSSGSWGVRTAFDAYPSITFLGNTLTIDETSALHRYTMDYSLPTNYIYEDLVDTTIVGYDVNSIGDAGAHFAGGIHRIIYRGSGYYLYLTSFIDGSWSAGELVSNLLGMNIQVEYSYRYDNQDDRINFIFYNGNGTGYIYFNHYDIPLPTPGAGIFGPRVWTT